MLLLDGFQYRQGTKEMGTGWTKIAENLTTLGMKASQRSVREKFGKLVTEFKRKEAAEERASGVEVDYTERDQAIEIIDIECVLGHESCLHFFSCMPLVPLHSRRHIEFSQE